jgi:hypothetical protein
MKCADCRYGEKCGQKIFFGSVGTTCDSYEAKPEGPKVDFLKKHLNLVTAELKLKRERLDSYEAKPKEEEEES